MWLSKVLNLEPKLGWGCRQFPVSHRPPPSSCLTSLRHRSSTARGRVTSIQARSCRSLIFSLSLFASEGSGCWSRLGVDPRASAHFVPPPRLGYPLTRLQQRSAREWAAPKDSSPFCRTKSLSCFQSHNPNLGPPHTLGPRPPPLPGRPQPCSFTAAWLWEFLDPQLHSLSSPRVSLIISRRPAAPKET